MCLCSSYVHIGVEGERRVSIGNEVGKESTDLLLAEAVNSMPLPPPSTSADP